MPGAAAYRLVILLDKQCNGAAATIADVFADTDINSLLNLENTGRFRILRDISGSLETEVGHDGTSYFHGRAIKEFSEYISLNLPLEFATQAGGSRVIGEVKSNNLVVMAFSSGNDSTNATWRARIRFSDK